LEGVCDRDVRDWERACGKYLGRYVRPIVGLRERREMALEMFGRGKKE
jgi:hypothetical protein